MKSTHSHIIQGILDTGDIGPEVLGLTPGNVIRMIIIEESAFEKRKKFPFTFISES